MKYLIPAFVFILAFSSYAAAKDMYVHSVNAAVHKAPSGKAKKTATLNKGDRVSVISKKGAWYKVKSTKGNGWVYKFMVKPTPVSGSDALYTKLRSFFYKLESISGKSRRRPSSYTATAAARGLREKRKHFADKYKSDYKALETLEAISITETEALEFLKKGVENE